jgi:hypothetical protein
MPRIELSQLLQPTATPEQVNFLTWFYSQFDNSSAANKKIINVEPLFYQGLIAGTEFLTYAATKLYIMYKGGFFATSIAANIFYTSFYDETNAFNLALVNDNAWWNVTSVAPNFSPMIANIKNIYFSRINIQSIDRMYFNGYRITLI